MQSIFRYPGGKSKKAIRDWIVAHKPGGMREYREPFVGGGGIFFCVHVDGPRWINDKHTGLMDVYRALSERPEAFIDLCRSVAPPEDGEDVTEMGPRGGKPVNKRLKDLFDSVCLNDEGDQAFRYFFVNRTVHGSGRVNYDIPSRLYFSNQTGWNIVNTNLLEKAAEWIDGTRITAGDYEPLFTEPGEAVWIYADPPYLTNNNLAPSSQLYQHCFTLEDHERFALIVRDCKHNVCVSYDDDPEGVVRELFKDLNIIDAQWKYCGTTNAEKDVGHELLILNYDPPLAATQVAIPEVQVGDALTVTEEGVLARHEATIEQGVLKAFEGVIETGEALRAIRDSGKPSQRLYRNVAKTFEEYVRARWMMCKGKANRLILATTLMERLKMAPMGAILPTNERQARELTRLPEDRWEEAWGQVVQQSEENSRPVTAKAIRDVVIDIEPSLAPAEPKAVFDRLWDLWERASAEEREQFREAITEIL